MNMINNNNDLSGSELGKVKEYFQHINNNPGMGLIAPFEYNHCCNYCGMKAVAKFTLAGFTMDLLHHTFAYSHFTIAPILVGNGHVGISN